MRKRFGFTPLERKLRPGSTDVPSVLTRAGCPCHVKNVQQGWGLKPHLSFLTGFTIVELLTALVIIAILVGFLIPAMSMVRRIAKETAQKHQLTTLDMALMAFKNDYGDYPPSEWQGIPPIFNYSGAQMLAEALVGWDLMGFHPDSEWTSDGCVLGGGMPIYDVNAPLNLDQRRGPYLELATTNAFKLDDLFGAGYTVPLDGQRFVICDVFGVKKIPIGGKMVKAGTPILYYKADPSSKTIESMFYDERIYNVYDNYYLVDLGKMAAPPAQRGLPENRHPLGLLLDNLYDYDYNGGIRDPKVTANPWPYRPDSYILISAGADGLYGTSDDIRNF